MISAAEAEQLASGINGRLRRFRGEEHVVALQLDVRRGPSVYNRRQWLEVRRCEVGRDARRAARRRATVSCLPSLFGFAATASFLAPPSTWRGEFWLRDLSPRRLRGLDLVFRLRHVDHHLGDLGLRVALRRLRAGLALLLRHDDQLGDLSRFTHFSREN